MQCEICGTERGRFFKMNFEGSDLIACENCSNYGTNKKPILENIKPKKSFAQSQVQQYRPQIQMKKFPESEHVLVSDFGQKIRKAREKRNMTIEELGKLLYTKASEVNRFESGSLKPSDNLIKKLENILEIKLMETISAEDFEDYSSSENESMTLEDMLMKKMKRKKESE
ncbi:MAG: multiprotein bridging factor aMBF1 [Candidatus Diapherotrites archaeon]